MATGEKRPECTSDELEKHYLLKVKKKGGIIKARGNCFLHQRWDKEGNDRGSGKCFPIPKGKSRSFRRRRLSELEFKTAEKAASKNCQKNLERKSTNQKSESANGAAFTGGKKERTEGKKENGTSNREAGKRTGRGMGGSSR